jgi:hypothetical protein
MAKFYCDAGSEGVDQGFEGMGMKVFPVPDSEKPQ